MAPGASTLLGTMGTKLGISKLFSSVRLGADPAKPNEFRRRSIQASLPNPAASSLISTPSPTTQWTAAHHASTSTTQVQATTNSAVVILDDPFTLVRNDVASARAAGEEAVALARAAAAAAKQAAALAQADDLSLLESLDGMSRSEWGLGTLVTSSGLESASYVNSVDDCTAGSPVHWQDMVQNSGVAHHTLEDYISDKQKLTAAFARDSGLGKAKQLEAEKPSVAQAPAVKKVRVLVASGKKGMRTPKERRSTKVSVSVPGKAAASGDFQKMLSTGVPGSLRDLMDATPGAVGLLTAAEEIQLAEGVQKLMKLEAAERELTEVLGRQPSKEEWARRLQMTSGALTHALAEGRRCKQRMMSCNMGLVIAIARKYSAWNLSLEEILTRGCGGLIKAIEKFDSRRGFKFSTYAHWWIRQAIGRSVTEQSRTVRMPPHIYELLARISKARDMLVRELGRQPGDEEVAELVGMTAVRLRKVLKSARPMVSMDKPSSMENEQTLGSFVASPVDESQEINIERKLLNRDLMNALHTLLPREREVLKLRFGLIDGRARTLEEVGAKFQVTRERIRQLEHRALKKLRQANRCAALQEYVD